MAHFLRVRFSLTLSLSTRLRACTVRLFLIVTLSKMGLKRARHHPSVFHHCSSRARRLLSDGFSSSSSSSLSPFGKEAVALGYHDGTCLECPPCEWREYVGFLPFHRIATGYQSQATSFLLLNSVILYYRSLTSTCQGLFSFVSRTK
jgi:hypothetical protein